MADRHRDPQLNVRPPTELRTDAQQLLEDRGLEMKGFVVACLTALTADPDQVLEWLRPHWPAPKPRGRPPKAADSTHEPEPQSEGHDR